MMFFHKDSARFVIIRPYNPTIGLNHQQGDQIVLENTSKFDAIKTYT